MFCRLYLSFWFYFGHPPLATFEEFSGLECSQLWKSNGIDWSRSLVKIQWTKPVLSFSGNLKCKNGFILKWRLGLFNKMYTFVKCYSFFIFQTNPTFSTAPPKGHTKNIYDYNIAQPLLHFGILAFFIGFLMNGDGIVSVHEVSYLVLQTLVWTTQSFLFLLRLASDWFK